MTVAALAAGLNHSIRVHGNETTPIRAITNDSRQVVDGSLYAALPGNHVDGHRFIPDAIRAGASAILCGPGHAPAEDREVSWFVAEDPRRALSELSDRFFGSPSRQIPVIGVTGTDGKTSTVYFMHQLLQLSGLRSGFLSTASMQIGDTETPNLLHQSTPEAPEVHGALRGMIEAGAEVVVLESTSHGLSHKTCRLADVCYRTAVFTNISHEHLEFHGSFERYRSDKANLFRSLAGTGEASVGIINADDPNADYFIKETPSRVVRYGTGTVDYQATEIALGTTGSSFILNHPAGSTPVTIPIPARFNVLNVLAAIAAVAETTGTPAGRVADLAGKLRSVAGRMQVIAETPFSVIVDYAHTPASFESALPFFRRQCSNRLIVVFGSAGERDLEKRPLQGAIADRYADIIILSDEDPRGEDRVSILRQIAAGATSREEGASLRLIPDRREAIATAYSIANPGDTVVLLGKGHERSIIGPNGPQPWDEARIARELLGAYQ